MTTWRLIGVSVLALALTVTPAAAMIGEPPTLDTHTTTAIEKIQAVFYDDVGRIKMGDFFSLHALRDLKGFRNGHDLHSRNTWPAK